MSQPEPCPRCGDSGSYRLPPLVVGGRRIHDGRTIPCRCGAGASGIHVPSWEARQFRLPGSPRRPPREEQADA